ncbi:S8 family peptidase [Flavobacterium sp.]|uniref:S8 family peptidase n=1 Tax=Flavobacterium sp. TaxID=239 RepID=UPI0039E25E49
MKKLFYLIFLSSIASFSQTKYYYFKGQKINIELDKRFLTINVSNETSVNSIMEYGFKDFVFLKDVKDSTKWAKIEFTPPHIYSDMEYLQKINSLRNNSSVLTVSPSFITSNGATIDMSSYFYVKLKSLNDVQLLHTISLAKNVEVIEQNQFMPLWFTLKCNKTTLDNALEVANYFYETGFFDGAVPDFMDVVFSNNNSDCTNDPLFQQQWGLYNTNNPNLDINACQAWSITEGENSIVAVIDSGIELEHQDLIDNIHPFSWDAVSQSSPSINATPHGTNVAGIIGALKNNNYQIVGTAPKTKLMSISMLSSGNLNLQRLANAINLAMINGAHVINNSWGCTPNGFIEDALNNVITNGRNGLGCVVVHASANNGNSNIPFPANTINNILVVGAMNENGSKASFSNFGNKLDLVAPGTNILTTDLYNNVILEQGTSFSAPFVSGVSALILSTNPCLTGKEVNDIIEKTAQKVGNYTYTYQTNRNNGRWNNEMGYGLVDAHAAVVKAQQLYSPTLDLMIADSFKDEGIEPNTITKKFWSSESIWIRNNDDGIEEHQNPEYSETIPNYVYVKIKNKSCVASSGNDELKLYWSKAGTSSTWPLSWEGNLYIDNVQMGAPIATITIPVLNPGQEIILKAPWLIPNPQNYATIVEEQDLWHFCILARIVSNDDQMTFPETNNDIQNIKNNNNIAMTNITVVDLIQNVTNGDTFGGVIYVSNPKNTSNIYYLELEVEEEEEGKSIAEEAEISIKMDNVLFNAWEKGGKKVAFLDNTNEEKRKIVKGNKVVLDHLLFDPNEVGTLKISFNFLTRELTEKSNYTYHIIQKDYFTDEIIGGETFVIKKPVRQPFLADAGETIMTDINQPIIISAEQINEAALYNWYDSNGELIFQGKDLTVSTDIVKKYKLEVIALTDGFKDYADVEVKLNPSKIESISPNPAVNQIQVNYKVNENTSAYLMVLGYYGSSTTSHNYIIDINQSNYIINLSEYTQGFYTVALVCSGEIVDAKNFIKN